MEQKKRIEVGELVTFIVDDRLRGRVKALTEIASGEARGLPGAEVEWLTGGTAVLALGWLVPATGKNSDGF